MADIDHHAGRLFRVDVCTHVCVRIPTPSDRTPLEVPSDRDRHDVGQVVGADLARPRVAGVPLSVMRLGGLHPYLGERTSGKPHTLAGAVLGQLVDEPGAAPRYRTGELEHDPIELGVRLRVNAGESRDVRG